MIQVVHSIHFPISARNFVEPVVACLNIQGIRAELWFENQPMHAAMARGIRVPHRHVDSDLSFNPVTFLRRLILYRRELRRVRPQVLHTHQARACVIPLLAARLEKVPVRVYHNHGLPYLGYCGPLRFLLRALERVNIWLATHVLLVSRSNLEAAREDGLLAEGKGNVLANGSAVGIDLNEFAAEYFEDAAKRNVRESLGIEESAFVLAYVGRPVKRKGFQLLLRAWERSRLGNSGGLLLMAGCTQKQCDRAL